MNKYHTIEDKFQSRKESNVSDKTRWPNYLVHLFGRKNHPYPLKHKGKVLRHIHGAPVRFTSQSEQKMWYGEPCPAC